MEQKNSNDSENSDIFFQPGYSIGPFQLIKILDKSGKFGIVYLGVHLETNEKVAIKLVSKNKDNIKSLYNEINIHKNLFHPYICKFHYAIETNYDIFIVSEYCRGGQVFRELVEEGAFEEAKACKIFSQILSGLEYMHNNYIAHRDIKLENMVFDEFNDAKLLDFGLSKSFKDEPVFHERVGSPLYLPAEIYSEEGYKGNIADIWGMGICLFCMVCGRFPFDGSDNGQFIKSLFRHEYEIPDSVSPQLKDLFSKILEKDPNKRFTIEQIKKHPWMSIIYFNFTKCPGIYVNKDILPIDIDIIKNIAGNNEPKIRKLISDILNCKHNNDTFIYHSKIEILKRNKEESVSDIRPSSKLFLNYIKENKSKKDYYQNDINKKVDELTTYILQEIKKDELRIITEIRNSLKLKKPKTEKKSNNCEINLKTLEKNNSNNDDYGKNEGKNEDNHLIEKKPSDKKIKKKKYNKLLSKTHKFNDINDIIKEFEKENNKEKTKKNKLNLLEEYIGPLFFIHDLIDEIITKVIKLKNTKEKRKLFIPVNNSTLNVFGIKSAQKVIGTIDQEEKKINSPKIESKQLNFSINKADIINFPSTTKNADKNFSFKFYKPSEKNSINAKYQKIDKTDKKIRDNKFQKNINKKLNMTSNYEYDKRNKPLIDLKNNVKKFDKKKILTHLQRNKSDCLNIFLNKKIKIFDKIMKEFKTQIENKKILGKTQKKRRKSQELSNRKINLFKNEELVENLKEKKRANSEKKAIQKLKAFNNKQKKEKQDDNNKFKKTNTLDERNKKNLFSKRIKRNSKNSNNINENLNIDSIISEKDEIRNSKKITKEEKQTNHNNHKTHNRNMIKSQYDFYSKNSMNSTFVNSARKNNTIVIDNYSQNQRRNTGRAWLIKKNKNKIEEENIVNKTSRQSHKRIKTTPIKITEKSKKNKEIKSSLFGNNNKNSFCQTGRNQKMNDFNKNSSTKESTTKKETQSKDKIIFQPKIIKKNLNKFMCKLALKSNNNKGSNKIEIQAKKNEIIVEKIISDCIGSNNITKRNLEKNHIKFSCKMHPEPDKKKLIFNLNLNVEEKNKSIVTYELIEGDIKSFEKVIASLKEKLE